MPSLKRIIEKFDDLLCRYIGLNEEITVPQAVINSEKGIYIVNNTVGKRHLVKEDWKSFTTADDLKQMSTDDKNKLGVAIGHSIAKNLTIQFSSADPTD